MEKVSDCKCGGTGWIAYEIPTSKIDGIFHMRTRITRCSCVFSTIFWKLGPIRYQNAEKEKMASESPSEDGGLGGADGGNFSGSGNSGS